MAKLSFFYMAARAQAVMKIIVDILIQKNIE